MLTITRTASQKILIGPDIVVIIDEVRGKQARVSIEAPRDVLVLRGELKEEQEAAELLLKWKAEAEAAEAEGRER